MTELKDLEPGTLPFYQELLRIAEGSEHDMDKALVPVLKRTIEDLAAKDEMESESDGP